MKKAYLGIDVGSVTTKGVVIDKDNNIIASSYFYTDGNPITATKKVIKELEEKINSNEYQVVGLGTTGASKKLIGTILGANVIKNEITAHAVGTMSIYPKVHTIFEIGGNDSKIIIIDNGVITDYDMNELCSSGIGLFLSNYKFDTLTEKNIYYTIVNNYLNGIGKNKNIKPPIVFQGGVSKNKAVVKAFEDVIGYDIYVDDNSHLMGALGVAIISKSSKEKVFNFDMKDIFFKTKEIELKFCPNTFYSIHK